MSKRLNAHLVGSDHPSDNESEGDGHVNLGIELLPETAMDADDSNANGVEGDGVVRHLGSNLPTGTGFSDQQEPITMRQTPAQLQIYAQAANAQLLDEAARKSGNQEKGKKLKRIPKITEKKNVPSILSTRPPAKQRQLGPVVQRDIYSFDASSNRARFQQFKTVDDGSKPISPRKPRNLPRKVDSNTAQSNDQAAGEYASREPQALSLRRSPRKKPTQTEPDQYHQLSTASGVLKDAENSEYSTQKSPSPPDLGLFVEDDKRSMADEGGGSLDQLSQTDENSRNPLQQPSSMGPESPNCKSNSAAAAPGYSSNRSAVGVEVDGDKRQERSTTTKLGKTSGVIRIRPSELPELDQTNPSEDPEDLLPAKKRKANDLAVVAQKMPSKSIKRTLDLPSKEYEYSGPNFYNGTPEDDRIFGVWEHLQKAMDATKRIGVRTTKGKKERFYVNLKDDLDVVTVAGWCQKATMELERLIQEPHESLSDPPEAFAEIECKVLELCGESNDRQPDFNDEVKIRGIYFHAIPKLVKLLYLATRCYMAKDVEEIDVDRLLSINHAHFKVLVRLIDLVVKMGFVAKRRYTRPNEGGLVEPVHNGMVLPLRDMKCELLKREPLTDWNRRERALQDARRRAQQDAMDLRQATQDAQKEEQQRELAAQRRKWRTLHEKRRLAEPSFPTQAKQRHLRLPEFGPEYDNDGVLFTRVDCFNHRVGPPPAMVARARHIDWEPEEVEALCNGLRELSGDHVFEQIFRAHCGKSGWLNKYNVTEIVTLAADAKEFYERENMKTLGYVEDWVKAIPLWVRPYRSDGEENDNNNDEAEYH